MTTADTTPTIEILPEHIIDQIKAGEVLERPASLIKELIENSLDAGSTEINIHLVENGMDLLSIEDNGHGMDFKNLPYAFLRHATSKLRTYEDLYRLRSFGFRGEALASVAASSRLTCTTQPKDLSREGGKIVINGGETQLLVPQKASAQGTSIFIKDLFFNTPARLKFIKSKVSEKSALKKMLYSFVLSNPQVTFTIKWDEKEKEIFKAVGLNENQLRVSQVFFGKRLQESTSLITSSEEYDNYKVQVYFTPDTYTTPQYRHHYLFANHRFFQDKSLHSAVLRNLDSLWRFGESGHYMVEILTPPSEIDVNVHPNKTQIKFMRSDVIYSLLVTSLKKGLKSIALPAIELPSAGREQSLFSRDENQMMDLMQFVSQEQGEQAEFIARPFGEDTILQSSSSFVRLSPRFILDSGSSPARLIDCQKLVALFLASGFAEFKQTQEVPTPLLISEPFKIKDKAVDAYFDIIKSFGLEFDRLNPEFIVLRTIPRFLPQSWTVDTANALIAYFLQEKKENPDVLYTFFCQTEMNEILNDMPQSIVEKMLQSTEVNRFVRLLTDEFLRACFSHEK